MKMPTASEMITDTEETVKEAATNVVVEEAIEEAIATKNPRKRNHRSTCRRRRVRTHRRAAKANATITTKEKVNTKRKKKESRIIALSPR